MPGRTGPRRAVVLVLLAVMTLGCEGTLGGPPTAATPPPGTQVGIPDPDDIDPARLEPLLGLQACQDAVPGAPDVDSGVLPLPEAAVLTEASVDGPLATAQGYSERTPVEIMVAYMRLDGWTVLTAEDEVFESEVVVERDGLRVFIKSQAVCARGSAFVMFGSDDPALVPAPAGMTGGS